MPAAAAINSLDGSAANAASVISIFLFDVFTENLLYSLYFANH